MIHFPIPSVSGLLNAILHRGGAGSNGPVPHGALATPFPQNPLIERLLTMGDLGSWNFQDPQASQTYWLDVARSMNPSTPKGLVALATALVGPKIESEALGPMDMTGIRVPLPRVTPRYNVPPERRFIYDSGSISPRAKAAGLLAGLSKVKLHAPETPSNVRDHLVDAAHDLNSENAHTYVEQTTEDLQNTHDPSQVFGGPKYPAPSQHSAPAPHKLPPMSAAKRRALALALAPHWPG